MADHKDDLDSGFWKAMRDNIPVEYIVVSMVKLLELLPVTERVIPISQGTNELIRYRLHVMLLQSRATAIHSKILSAAYAFLVRFMYHQPLTVEDILRPVFRVFNGGSSSSPYSSVFMPVPETLLDMWEALRMGLRLAHVSDVVVVCCMV
jgi:hypothetical protein